VEESTNSSMGAKIINTSVPRYSLKEIIINLPFFKDE
jgi:hypothetical protein